MKSKIEKLGKVSITVEKDEHNSNKAYNRLVIVNARGGSYISRKAVPAGIPITNEIYWKKLISGVSDLIPEEASAANQLADKNYVNNGIATASATFRGTFNTLVELQAVEADNNDYGFVITNDADNDTQYARYKYNGTQWVFEYKINNNNFSPAQWAAITSGINQTGNEKLNALIVKDNPQVINLTANDISQRFNIPITVGTKLIFHVTEITGTTEHDMINVNVEYAPAVTTVEGYDVYIGDNLIWDAHNFYSEIQTALQTNKTIDVEIEAFVGVKGYIYPIYDASIVNTAAPGLMSTNDKTNLDTVTDKLRYVVRDGNKLRIKDENNINRGYIVGSSGKLEIKANEVLSIGSNDGNVNVNAKSNNITLTGETVNVNGRLSVHAPIGNDTISLYKDVNGLYANYIRLGDDITIFTNNRIRTYCRTIAIGSNNNIRYDDATYELNIAVNELRIGYYEGDQRLLIDDTETKIRAQNGNSSISLQNSDFRVVFPNAGDINFIASGDNTPYTTLKTLVTASKRISININSYLQANKPMPLGGSYNYTTDYGNVILQVVSIVDWYEGGDNPLDVSVGATIVAMGYKTLESNDSAIYNRYTVFFFNVDIDDGTLQYYKTITQSNQINTLSKVERAALVSLGYTLDKEIIGILSNLATTDKTSLVAAVNELKGMIDNIQPSGGGSDSISRAELNETEQLIATALSSLNDRITAIENQLNGGN